MPTDRPCDQETVPDSCADTGGLVSVQLDITVTAGGLSNVWHKNAVVFISRRDEFLFPNLEDEQKYIQDQSKKISRDFGGCLKEQIELVLSSSASAVNLTQVADCVSAEIAAPHRLLGSPPRGVFISQKDNSQLAGISANFAVCAGKGDWCVNAPAQSFGQGHVIAHAKYEYEYRYRNGRGTKNAFFYAVLLPLRRPPRSIG